MFQDFTYSMKCFTDQGNQSLREGGSMDRRPERAEEAIQFRFVLQILASSHAKCACRNGGHMESG